MKEKQWRMLPQIMCLLTKIRSKFPQADLVVSGIPPRFRTDEIRSKVKEYNVSMKRWCDDNSITFVDNEIPFELRDGNFDKVSTLDQGLLDVFILTDGVPSVC